MEQYRDQNVPPFPNGPRDLTSVQNPRVKTWASLRERKFRDKSKLFLVEGARAVGEAMLTGQDIQAAIYCEKLVRTERARTILDALPPRIVWRVSEEIVRRLSDRDEPGEIFCVCPHLDLPLDDLPRTGNPFFVVMDQPASPGNIGMVMRTADGAGADALIIIEPAADLYHPVAVRNTVGSLFGLPVARARSVEAFIDWYEQRWATRPGALMVATIPEAEMDYSSLDNIDRPIFVIFGSEERGVSPQLRQRSDLHISIKMLGRADSLSISSAAAVIICDVVRKRGRGRYATPHHERTPEIFRQPSHGRMEAGGGLPEAGDE